MAKRMGRPSKPPIPGELAPLSVRITATLKSKLQAAAEGNGRSISAEVEARLEDSFKKDAVIKLVEANRALNEANKAVAEEIRTLLGYLNKKLGREP